MYGDEAKLSSFENLFNSKLHLKYVSNLDEITVGASPTHCGWGSVEQGLIARVMADRGICVEVAQRDDDGSFRRDDVAAEAVRRVMVDGEEGKMLARNARKLRVEVVGDDRRARQDVNCLERQCFTE